jgi:hypothetical protein
MYSVYEDTVLDPFWGTGTTSLAAMVAGRDSIGYELDEEFVQLFQERVENVPTISKKVIKQRLGGHKEFVKERLANGKEFKYDANNYNVPVMTKQEKPIQFYSVTSSHETDAGYKILHEPVEDVDTVVEELGSGGEITSLSDF